MIRELSELGKNLRVQKADNEWVHDALKEEVISLVVTIKPDGSFSSIKPIENKRTMAEAIQRSSNKNARLLLDNAGYVLGVYDDESNAFKKKVREKGEANAHEVFKKDVAAKMALFIDRLKEIKELVEVQPVLNFYIGNKEKGIAQIDQNYFFKSIPSRNRSGNIAFLVFGNDKYMHESNAVYEIIIKAYEEKQQKIISVDKCPCSVCGKDEYPVGDYTHFPIKGVPGDKEPAGGRKLISYNGDHNPFESYGMVGNKNSMICTNCAKTYVEGLNWLLSDGTVTISEKQKEDIFYSHRWPRKRSQNYFVDSTMVYWTRSNKELPEIDYLETPNPEDITRLIESLTTGSEKESRYLEPEQFYSFTLSGSTARVVVRDWIETSLYEFKYSIVKWFRDIGVAEYDRHSGTLKTHYARLYDLARCCQRINSDGSYDKDDVYMSRVAGYLWNAALKSTILPLSLLTKVIERAQTDKNGVTADRAALIKIILNRQNKGGDFMISKKLSEGTKPVAYVCGQIFAKLESIQKAALGDLNAGIRERYFTYAMTMPSAAFGRLFDLNSKHYTKMKNEKPGLAITLDKDLQELCKDIDINNLPVTFKLEEKGQFAIGYYHQKQAQYSTNKSKDNQEEK